MRQFKTLICGALSLLALAACSSDEELAELGGNTANSGQTRAVSLMASMKGVDTRALKAEADGSITATFEEGDPVYVFKGDTKVGELSATEVTDDGAEAKLVGTITGSVAVNDNLTFRYLAEAVSYTGQQGTLADIAENFDYAEGTLPVAEVTGDVVGFGADATLTLDPVQSITKFHFTDGTNDIPARWISIKADGLTDDIDITHPRGSSNIYVAMTNSAEATYTFEVCDKNFNIYTGTKTASQLENGKSYATTVSLTEVPVSDAVKKLPLYWVVPTDVVTEDKNDLTQNFQFASTFKSVGYYWNQTEAKDFFGAIHEANWPEDGLNFNTYYTRSNAISGIGTGYHQPIEHEFYSILPVEYINTESYSPVSLYNTDNGSDVTDFISPEDGQLKTFTLFYPKWGYNSATQAGVSETSYWVLASHPTEDVKGVVHAIRFIGTDYASYWRYEYEQKPVPEEERGTYSTYTVFTITAVLLSEGVADETAAKTAIAVWKEKANSDLGTFTATNGYNDNEKVACQRVFYGNGYGTAPYPTVSGVYLTTTSRTATYVRRMHFAGATAFVCDINSGTNAKMSVRLFRDGN